ncbi:MAG: RloB domain-containing protein [Bacteroidetes bacterium]|nr:MAG: RloB domain-containing protein [Bacteroidota bacterium]
MKPIFFVFCEGKTEEAYSNFLKQKYGIPIKIKTKIIGQEISGKIIANHKREIQKGNYSKDDKVFLMYDIDSAEILSRLQNIPEAIILASNPCVELWFLLHYRDQNAHITSSQCTRELKGVNPQYEKGALNRTLEAALNSGQTDAAERAKNKAEYSNPSSTVYKLIDELEKVKK